MNEKSCLCEGGPKLVTSIPAGYKGKVTCANCGGVVQWPRPEKKYEGNDEVERYVFELRKNQAGMTFEIAVLTMLRRIEKACQRGR